MEWFWDAYIADPTQRSDIAASPNHATIEQLRGLPPTLLLVDEADVLRDEGEAYAAKPAWPVSPSRPSATTARSRLHDAHPLSKTNAARAAIAQAIGFFGQAFGTD